MGGGGRAGMWGDAGRGLSVVYLGMHQAILGNSIRVRLIPRNQISRPDVRQLAAQQRPNPRYRGNCPQSDISSVRGITQTVLLHRIA